MRILAGTLLIIVIAVILALLWHGGAFLPRWVEWKESDCYDKSGVCELAVKNKKVYISSKDREIWTSPAGVKVQDAMFSDIDNDGEDELVLLCWKLGRYGEHKPFWIDKDEAKWSQHIFVYEYSAAQEVRPKWMSSYIGLDVMEMTDNGKEAPGNRLFLTEPDGKRNSFVWGSWGFSKEDTDISFVVFGDILIHEPIYRYALQNSNTTDIDSGLHNTNPFGFLFENVQDAISQSDVAVINQETPFVEEPSRYSDYPRFGTPLPVGEAIVSAGFDAVTCATNHMLDQGAEGVGTTKKFFDDNHILCLGIQPEEEPERLPYQLMVKGGIRFALLNYTYGTNGIRPPEGHADMVHLLEDAEQVREDIEQAKVESDFVIAFVHWGTENEEQPDEFQKKWTQVFLESGVDVVVGTHPHVLQPYEVLEGEDGHRMLVYYSIGNFISAQPEKSCTKGGMAGFTVSLTQEGYEITEYTLKPLTINWHEGGKYSVEF